MAVKMTEAEEKAIRKQLGDKTGSLMGHIRATLGFSVKLEQTKKKHQKP